MCIRDSPYIYIGGGAAGAGMTEDIKALAEKIDAYIGCTFMGLSALPNSYDRFLGMQGMHGQYASSMANKEADLIIGLGVRFSDRACLLYTSADAFLLPKFKSY